MSSRRKSRSFERKANPGNENYKSTPKKEINLDQYPYTFYSDNGTKFVFHSDLSKTARKLGQTYNVFIATLTNGYKTFVLFKDNNPIYDNQQIDAIAIHIELLHYNIKMESKEKAYKG